MNDQDSNQPLSGHLFTETLDHDGGRKVTAYIPPKPPEALIFCADGQSTPTWANTLEKAGSPPTMIVGIHGRTEEMPRLHEYSPVFNEAQFSAHEEFFVHQASQWAKERFESTSQRSEPPSSASPPEENWP